MGSATYDYRCEILDWIDGDSCRVLIDLGFDIRLRETVRVFGINAPELRGAQKTLGKAAREYALNIAAIGAQVTIRSIKPDKPSEKYGRWLAVVTLPGNRDFADAMLAAGQARAWDGKGPRPS